MLKNYIKKKEAEQLQKPTVNEKLQTVTTQITGNTKVLSCKTK